MEILGILLTPVVEISKCLLVPIRQQIGCCFHYHKNVRGLRAEMVELVRIRGAIRNRADEARRKGETIDFTVEEWFKKVDEIESDVKKKLDDHVEDDKRICSSSGCFPDLGSRCRLNEEAIEKMAVVRELQKHGTFSSVSHLGPPPSIDQTLTGCFEPFESTKSAMAQVMAALDNNEVDIIGVFGIGGIGKTTLMMEVAKQAKREQIFDEVVMTTVSHNLHMEKLQTEIAEQLGLKLDETSLFVRALRLATRLKLEKKVLIILDDVWERIELVQVGIPHGAEHCGCKIVVTTRSEDVCNEMDCKSSINVKVLNADDSWKLFKRFAGNIVDSPTLHTVAKKVAQEAGGLPIVLVTLGRALRNKEPLRWSEALKALRTSKHEEIKGMNEKVFSCIKLSFDYIQSEEAKFCFLYCSVFPEDYDISAENLVMYLVGEGFFANLETLDERRNRVHAIIDSLKASCLLLCSEIEGYVKMHDVVRDVAIAIASSDSYGFMIKAGLELRYFPQVENSKSVRRFSLIKSKVYKYPDRMEFPELRALLMQCGQFVVNIPNDFFTGLKALKVLDLKGHSGILPTSIKCLTNLRTLCIHGGSLKQASILGELANLEILSLKQSSLDVFPVEIRRLTNLRVLDLRLRRSHQYSSYDDVTVPPNVISGLRKLEEMYLGKSFTRWEVEELSRRSFANLAEVASLDHLTTLEIHIRDYNCFFVDFVSPLQNLMNFKIEVSANTYDSEPSKARRLVVDMRDDSGGLPKRIGSWARVLLKRTEQLHLKNWKGLQNVEQLYEEGFNPLAWLHIFNCGINIICSSTFLRNFVCLEKLTIKSCSECEVVFLSDNHNIEKSMLLCLTSVSFRDLPKLISIWKGIDPYVFQNLEYIAVVKCPKLLKLFTPMYAKLLKRLVLLEIHCCEGMVTVMSNDDDDQLVAYSQGFNGNKIIFPQLEILMLSDLRNLTSLIQPKILLDFPSLEWLRIELCPKLKQLPFGSQSLSKLSKFDADRTWFEGLEFLDETIKNCMEDCFEELHFEEDCNNTN